MDEQFLTVFLEESTEHLQSLNDNVLVLEKNPTDLKVVGEIFRSAHTFKGMSATMGFTDMANLTHQMENVLDDIRNQIQDVTPVVIDIIFECIDLLERMVSDVQNGGTGVMDVSSTIDSLIRFKENKTNNIHTENKSILNEVTTNTSSTHKVIVTLTEECSMKSVRSYMVLDALNQIAEVIKTEPAIDTLEKGEFDLEFIIHLNTSSSSEEIEEIIQSISEIDSIKIEENEKEEELPTFSKEKEEAKGNTVQSTENTSSDKKIKQLTNSTIRVNLEKIEELVNMFEETVIERGHIEEIAKSLENKELQERLEKLSNVSKDLQNLVLNMRMVPVETVFNRFPRMVRTLAKDLGKKIDLVIDGEDTEIDRIVIDEIGDPLVHLIRNSVDHGVETIEKRKKIGKPEVGTVNLKAYHSGNSVIIEISDDGNGINRANVLSKAIKNGIITEGESSRLSNREVYDLLFAPGFSTAEVISDISGRGVGLDVVKTTITKLGGTLQVESEEGKGSTFIIELPLTLSIIQTMLISSKENKYGIPLGNIVETMKISKDEIQVLQKKEVINYRDKIIPVLSLNKIFFNEDWFNSGKPNNDYLVVVVKSMDGLFALAVDEIYGQREIVLKTLGGFFQDSKYFSGATIMGDGKVVLILNCDTIRKG